MSDKIIDWNKPLLIPAGEVLGYTIIHDGSGAIKTNVTVKCGSYGSPISYSVNAVTGCPINSDMLNPTRFEIFNKISIREMAIDRVRDMQSQRRYMAPERIINELIDAGFISNGY